MLQHRISVLGATSLLTLFMVWSGGCGDKPGGGGTPDSAVDGDGAAPDGSAVDAGDQDQDADTDADTTPVCGNGTVDDGEACDTAITAGPGSCPTAADCDTGSPCQPGFVRDPGTCQAVCDGTIITACSDGDGCCPTGCDADSDADCPSVCGNGVVELGETCDTAIAAGLEGACPVQTDCDTGDPCLVGYVRNDLTCQAVCDATSVGACAGGDGCCPPGCNANDDGDCSPVCGNGAVETGEVCDTGITAGPGACPSATNCATADPCEPGFVQGDGTCQATCATATITSCVGADGCCPAGCDATVDSDCPAICGNGVLEPGEACDTAIATGPGACPTVADCDTGDPCAIGYVDNGGTCDAVCGVNPVTSCTGGDGCCPPGCDAVSDTDCTAICGNGVVEPGETCDTGISGGAGACPTVAGCDTGDPCQPGVVVNDTTCQALCDVAPVGCIDNDGCCNSGCHAGTDNDCVAVCGNGYLEPGELCDTGIPSGAGACPTGCDDGDPCTTDTLVGAACQAACTFEPTVPVNPTHGFVLSAATWPVPVGGHPGNGFYVADHPTGDQNEGWVTRDMDGDGLPDLVWTEDPNGYYDVHGLAATPHWKVFFNNGAGFDLIETIWPVPVGGHPGNGFYVADHPSDDQNEGWVTRDINGDGLPDLVWTEDPDGYYDVFGLGTTPHWKVFFNNGAGFDLAETVWPVPVGGHPGNGFYVTDHPTGDQNEGWVFRDMDGDGLPDLVWTEDPDGYYDVFGLGTTPHWKVFFNNGAGFDLSETIWPVPVGGHPGNGFYVADHPTGDQNEGWVTRDIDGDGLPDLVWTEDPDGYYDVFGLGAAPYWQLFLNQ